MQVLALGESHCHTRQVRAATHTHSVHFADRGAVDMMLPISATGAHKQHALPSLACTPRFKHKLRQAGSGLLTARCPTLQRTGRSTSSCVKAGVTVQQTKSAATPSTLVDLPFLSEHFVPASANLPKDAFRARRKADAIVLAPKGVNKGASVPAVVFCHGFSQPPTNYMSTFEKFAEQGWLVIAPTTSLFDILGEVETCGLRDKPPAKLQTALILDALRSAQYLYEEQKEYKISSLLLCGHSMGGAGALVAASKLKGMVTGVGVMAPAVKQTLKTAVNPGLAMGDDAGKVAAIEFFKTDYDSKAPLNILAGEKDMIVNQEEVRSLYTAAFEGNKTGDLKLYLLPGSHIGFEDNVEVEFNGPILQQLLFKVIDFLLYKAEVTKLITGDYSDQRQLAQDVLVSTFKAALEGAGTDAVLDRGIANATVAKPPSKQELAELAASAEATPAEGKWVIPTMLLLSYAGIHAYTFTNSAELFLDGGFELPLFSAAGLAIVTAIAAGLVYENVILAAGRFITDGGKKNLDLLDALNDPRFLFHSSAPLLAIAGLDMGQRLGVGWASNPLVDVGVTLAVLGVVFLSTIRNTLLLQTRPTWSAGIFHYTYDDKGFDFTRIVPVAAVTVLLTALGISATLDDISSWPFATGPAICLALSAGIIPKRVAPLIITGNAGEALMLLSLMVTEASLLGVHVF